MTARHVAPGQGTGLGLAIVKHNVETYPVLFRRDWRVIHPTREFLNNRTSRRGLGSARA